MVNLEFKKLIDNLFNNIEILHKDENAKRHGFNTWDEFQARRKENESN